MVFRFFFATFALNLDNAKRNMKKHLIILTMLAVGVQAMAQADGSLQDSTSSTAKGLKGLMRKVGTMIDSMSVSGVDRRYIDAPAKPWQLIVKSSNVLKKFTNFAPH